MPAPILSLVPAGLTVDRLLPGPERILLVTRPDQDAAPCPTCARLSARRHSAYQRHLADLPWQGRLVELRVRVRRLRCANTACPRVIFAERLPGVTLPKARRTVRLSEAQTSIGLALGGEPGSRLAKKLAMPASGDTLLRLVRSAGSKPITPLRVLGVDDWAWRRGQRYGTILCDLEKGCVVDLLPDRSAAALAAWIERHPGIELIARDRAGVYADGARQGAPKATQIADRWHLLKNMSEALQHVADRYYTRIRTAAKTASIATGEAEVDTVPALPPRPPPTKLEQGQRDRLAARQARFDHVVALRGRGLTLDAIVAATGLSRSTVKRWLRRDSVPTWRKPRCASILDGYRDHLGHRWREGCRNASALWRELRARGFTGRPGVVRQWTARMRRRENAVGRRPSPPQVPSGRRLARLLTTEPARLGANDRRLVELARAAAPELAEAADLAVAFARMVRDKDGAGDRLDSWLDAAAASKLAPFARGLRQDLPAVRAGCVPTGGVGGRARSHRRSAARGRWPGAAIVGLR